RGGRGAGPDHRRYRLLQALRLGNGGPRRGPRGADPWRRRLYARHGGGAAVPGRAAVPHLRGRVRRAAIAHREGHDPGCEEMRRRGLLAAPALLVAPARAQSSVTGAWPNGPVRIVSPFTPGG